MVLLQRFVEVRLIVDKLLLQFTFVVILVLEALLAIGLSIGCLILRVQLVAKYWLLVEEMQLTAVL